MAQRALALFMDPARRPHQPHPIAQVVLQGPEALGIRAEVERDTEAMERQRDRLQPRQGADRHYFEGIEIPLVEEDAEGHALLGYDEPAVCKRRLRVGMALRCVTSGRCMTHRCSERGWISLGGLALSSLATGVSWLGWRRSLAMRQASNLVRVLISW